MVLRAPQVPEDVGAVEVTYYYYNRKDILYGYYFFINVPMHFFIPKLCESVCTYAVYVKRLQASQDIRSCELDTSQDLLIFHRS